MLDSPIPSQSNIPPQPEKTIWMGSSSQVVNLWRFIAALLVIIALIPLREAWHVYGETNYGAYEKYYGMVSLAVFFLPIIYIYWHWQKIKHHTFKLTTERLIEQSGVFTRRKENLELYRVKDIAASESFFEHMFGCGTIIIESSDRSTPILEVTSVKNPHQVKDTMRAAVEEQRVQKGVRELD